MLVKINEESVPNDLDGFAKLVKDQKVDAAADLVVVRMGQEETLKAAKMPMVVQASQVPMRPGFRAGGAGFAFPNIRINPGNLQPGQFGPGGNTTVRMETVVNGVRTLRQQDGNQFSGEFSKDGLKITVAGKMDNGKAIPSEITVTEGKETKKYSSVKDVPAEHRAILPRIMPSPQTSIQIMPGLRDGFVPLP